MMTTRQLVILTVYGIAFWFTAAICVKLGGSIGIFGKTASVFTFLISIFISWLSILLNIKIANLSSQQIVPGVCYGLMIATFFDSIFITWFSKLYGSEDEKIIMGAAWILWGVSFFIIFAIFEYKRRHVGEDFQSLKRDQYIYTIICGIVLWLFGGLTCKFGESFSIFGQKASILSFIVAIPSLWISIVAVIKVGNLKKDQIITGVSIALSAAVFCDGIAFTWFRALYGKQLYHIRLGSAWILWGGFLTFLFSFVEEYRFKE